MDMHSFHSVGNSENCTFLQNYHTKKLGEILVFYVLIVASEILFSLRILTGKKAQLNKTPALTKSANIGIGVVGTSNQFLDWNKIFKKIKQLLQRLRSL